MSIMLYRSGDKHTIRGKLCEMGVFKDDMLHTLLQQGWFVNPDEISNAVAVDDKDVAATETKKPAVKRK